ELSEAILDSTSMNRSIEYSKVLQLSDPSSLSSSSSSSSSSTTISTNPALWTIDQVEEWLKTNNFDDCVDI
ncbi:unnamed protein product, partial [Rotaria magnacalcarata]